MGTAMPGSSIEMFKLLKKPIKQGIITSFYGRRY